MVQWFTPPLDKCVICVIFEKVQEVAILLERFYFEKY